MQPSPAEIAVQVRNALAEDLGSGDLLGAVPGEPSVREVLAAGAGIVCFSGDKLLGGPQAGIIAGRAELVQACRRHPLYRALRLDKLALAALEATLLVHREGGRIPALAMLEEPGDAGGLAEALAARGLPVAVEADVGYSGGGALPGRELPGRVVALRGRSPERLAGYLRGWDPPVVARVSRDALLLDPRTLLPGQREVLIEAAVAAWEQVK